MVIIQEETTKNPITLIGKEAGICYNSDISNDEKNFKRGISCINSNHGRVLEFPQLYLIITGYSARCIRELYTHIGGMPTRLQASTRYINYDNFEYFTPDSIKKDTQLKQLYDETMSTIIKNYNSLLNLGVKKEDVANILPLGMNTEIVLRTNLRHLIDIMSTRQCSRAYSEIRNLMKEIKQELCKYSEEWNILCNNYMNVKCDNLRYCPEEKSCGRYPQG